ncbi:MAG: hypothetical protein HQK76_14660 [Desulfobacterales bacterium]|nr:hypothetical protein [Desulfobacterales bacterium]
MKTSYTVFFLFILLLGISNLGIISAFSEVAPQKTADTISAKDAINAASKNNKYLALLCYDSQNSLYKEMQATLNKFNEESKEKIQVYELLTSDTKEAEIVEMYRINNAPLPLLLVMAPNGAITGGFPQKVMTEQLSKSIVSESISKIIKAMQSEKVVLVLLQNSKTNYNEESSQAARDFSNDERLKEMVEMFNIDPNTPDNKDFIAQCRLKPDIKESTIVMIIPPGRIAGVYPGKITKDKLLSALATCSAGSGCCPK